MERAKTPARDNLSPDDGDEAAERHLGHMVAAGLVNVRVHLQKARQRRAVVDEHPGERARAIRRRAMGLAPRRGPASRQQEVDVGKQPGCRELSAVVVGAVSDAKLGLGDHKPHPVAAG